MLVARPVKYRALVMMKCHMILLVVYIAENLYERSTFLDAAKKFILPGCNSIW